MKFSTYTGAKSVSQNQIRPNNTLSISVDLMRLENLKWKIQEMKEGFSITDVEIANYDEQVRKKSVKFSHRFNFYSISVETIQNQYRSIAAGTENDRRFQTPDAVYRISINGYEKESGSIEAGEFAQG